MKIGFCMLLWTTSVSADHKPILEDLKKTGYDGVEIPVFAGTSDDYIKIGGMFQIHPIGTLDSISATHLLRYASMMIVLDTRE